MTLESTHELSLTRIIDEIVAAEALKTDTEARFPRRAMTALGEAGLLGVISSVEVGGSGKGMGVAAAIVERIAARCGSTAMVLCMHFCGTAVIEKFGDKATREAIASGRHLTTLAFSEEGSRSHFWAPLSTATSEGNQVVLSAKKSWVTSAGEADSYVWSSRPLRAEGASTIWLVPSKANGLKIPAPFDGLGLRGNASSPIAASGVTIPPEAILGGDGKGFDVMMGVVLPLFSVLSASVSLGIMDGALERAVSHVAGTGLDHLSQKLADLPTIRAKIAEAKIRADSVRTLRDDTVSALESSRPDGMLRVLEVKAAAGDAALAVTDVAMRVCGGAAFRKEAGVERLFRDARAASVMAPTSDVLYDFIGKVVCGLPLF